MNRERVVAGILFIGIGLLLFLVNLGIISWWTLNSLWYLWPLILVVIGINTIFKRSIIVSVITWILFFSILIGYGIYYDRNTVGNIKDDINDVLFELKKYGMEDTNRGELNLELGGLKLDIGSTYNSVVMETNYPSEYIDITNFQRNSGNYTGINFNLFNTDNNASRIGRINFGILNPRQNGYYINLNEDVLWDIDGNLGGVSGEFNLQNLQVSDLNLNVGAGNLTLKFGNQYHESNVVINSGASSLDIIIMEEMGVRVKFDGIVSKSNIGDLAWEQREGYYYSPNYEEASEKIHFDITTGVGKINIAVR